ncbi:hypothetical protein [Clostridium tetanomorphum]|nr:hypothetical protein [Clostridium tetanomorphum]SQC02808.1 exported protein [Clostridium tetanomorphum]
MDENINKIQLSHDGKYVSYIKNGNIEIINTLNGEKTSVESSLGELNYYTWLPDRARMYIFEKHIKENGQSYMKLYSYDKDKNHKEEVLDNHYNKINIPLANSKYNIQDIVMSTLTGVSYVKVETNNERSNIYRLNIMSQTEKYKGYLKIGNINILNRDDTMIYEDLRYGKIRVADKQNSISIPDTKRLCLLGVDNQDVIYLGSINEEEKIESIYYDNIDDEDKKWNRINIDNPCKSEDIKILKSGKVYINDKAKSAIIGVSLGKEIKYKGKIVAYYDKGFGVLYNGKFTKIKY